MQMLPSHDALPFLFTRPGMFCVSNSSSLRRMPSLVRKPTMILGTPSRNDWVQNLRSLRSYFSMSRSFSISADVFSSTQLIGSSLFSGLQSHTITCQNLVTRKATDGPTSIDLAAKYHLCLSDSCTHHRAILSVIVCQYLFSIVNVVSRCRIPLVGNERQCLELVPWSVQSSTFREHGCA